MSSFSQEKGLESYGEVGIVDQFFPKISQYSHVFLSSAQGV